MVVAFWTRCTNYVLWARWLVIVPFGTDHALGMLPLATADALAIVPLSFAITDAPIYSLLRYMHLSSHPCLPWSSIADSYHPWLDTPIFMPAWVAALVIPPFPNCIDFVTLTLPCPWLSAMSALIIDYSPLCSMCTLNYVNLAGIDALIMFPFSLARRPECTVLEALYMEGLSRRGR